MLREMMVVGEEVTKSRSNLAESNRRSLSLPTTTTRWLPNQPSSIFRTSLSLRQVSCQMPPRLARSRLQRRDWPIHCASGNQNVCVLASPRKHLWRTLTSTTDDNQTALGQGGVPNALNAVAKAALSSSATPKSEYLPALYEVLRVAANLCMDHGARSIRLCLTLKLKSHRR